MDFSKLTNIQLDALKEISNIGAGNAATALSVLLGTPIDMEIPFIKIIDIEGIYNNISLEQIVVGVLIEAKGEVEGNILFLFKEEVASEVIKKFTGEAGNTFNELGESVVCEFGNIISSTYMNAISEFTGLSMIAGVPAIAHDIEGAVIPSMFIATVEDAEKILEIKIILKGFDGEEVGADFYYLPKENSLEKIFKSIGLI
ncbi:MAG: chemotaxis protein CheC [Sarcina sp.]